MLVILFVNFKGSCTAGSIKSSKILLLTTFYLAIHAVASYMSAEPIPVSNYS